MSWIISKKADLLLLFGPVWLCWLIIFSLPSEVTSIDAPLWVWVVFVIGIDVSHVWSTLFRTYLDHEEFQNHRRLLTWTPLVVFTLTLLVASFSLHLFWRILAYVAVFHFMKQQFGFMRIYKAKASDFRKQVISDNFVIYWSMLYPVLFWHMNIDRNFSWFMAGDFVQWNIKHIGLFNTIGSGIYLVVIGAWLIQELAFSSTRLPIGKILWVMTTATNWFLGIVWFNSDLIFTLTNVIAHGVPYLALVYFYQNKKMKLRKQWISPRFLGHFLLVILVLAMVEEIFWEVMVNKEFRSIFPTVEVPYVILVLATALLSVPQITHYVVDGFIWKSNEKNPYLKKVLFPSV